MNIREETKQMKLASPLLAATAMEKRNEALACIREALNAHKEEILRRTGRILPWPGKTMWRRRW